MNYSEARKIILDAGWQGNNSRWQDIPDYGRKNLFYFTYRWREVQVCSPTGEGFCNFKFHDIHGNILRITTREYMDGEKVDPKLEFWGLE